MIINYYGLACFKITCKAPGGQEYSLITDPFNPKLAGVKLPRLKADIVMQE